MELCEKLLLLGADRPIDAAQVAAVDPVKVVFVGRCNSEGIKSVPFLQRLRPFVRKRAARSKRPCVAQGRLESAG
jgi:hypothetical protein